MSSSIYYRNAIRANEGHVEILPKFAPSVPKRGVMFVHGAGSDSLYCISPTGKQSTVTNSIVDAGHVGVAQDVGGPATWGNSTAVGAMTTVYNHLIARPGVKDDKVFLMFGSMGGITSLNWAAANPTKVAGIMGVIPVINPNDIKTNNRWNYGPEINAAYGGNYVEATYGANYNPRTMANTSKYAGIPMLFFYGLTDDLCLPGETEGFATAANSNGADVTLVAINDGHTFTTYDTVATSSNLALIQDFLAEHN